MDPQPFKYTYVHTYIHTVHTYTHNIYTYWRTLTQSDTIPYLHISHRQVVDVRGVDRDEPLHQRAPWLRGRLPRRQPAR